MGTGKARLIRIILLIIAVMAIIISVILLAGDARARRDSMKKLEKVRNTHDNTLSEQADTTKTPDPASERINVNVNVSEQNAACLQLESLRKKNSELAAWLKIPGTVIDHPVMLREGDSEFYLSHGFDRKEDRNGLLVLDGRENYELSSDLLIINGHNLRSGNMFGALAGYKDYDFACGHDDIELDTVYEVGLYKVFAVILTDADTAPDEFSYYDRIDFDSEDEFDSFVERACSDSIHKLAGTPLYGTRLLMLSTCEYSRDDGRLIVLARKVN